MRMLTIIGVILGLLIGSGGWINHALQDAAERLASRVEQVSMDLKRGDWTAARNGSEQLHSSWKEDARWWPVVLDHQEIDNIEFTMARTGEYVKNKDLALAQGQLAELKLMVEHIPRKEKVNLENIL